MKNKPTERAEVQRCEWACPWYFVDHDNDSFCKELDTQVVWGELHENCPLKKKSFFCCLKEEK